MENYIKPLHIPDDITSKILFHLPQKSLLRFTLVSKSWMNYIQSHKFRHPHINNKRKHLIFSSRGGSFFSTHDRREEADVDLKSMVLSTAPIHLDRHHIIGHCNGIICLARNDGEKNKTILLWNPSLRQCRRVPLRLFPVVRWHFAGFGYDCKNQDYKILLCSNDRDYNMTLLRYSLKTDMWRKISPDRTRFDQSDDFGGCLCFEGKLHWTIKGERERRVKSLLIFNMADDTFTQFAMPIGSPDDEDTGSNLGVFRGRLSLVKRKFHDMTEEFEIWSTDDPTTPASWMKALSILPTRLSLKTPFLRPMGLDPWWAGYINLTTDGKVLVELSTTRCTGLNSNVRLELRGGITSRVQAHELIYRESALMYDAETHQMEVYHHEGNTAFTLTWYAITDYLESFVSVKSNPGWGKVGNYLLSGHIVNPQEVMMAVFFACFSIIVIIVMHYRSH